MYDLSSKFNNFYKEKVVLPKDVQKDLRNKGNINIQRLKDGLEEYNLENGTSYAIKESHVQGSVAMSTVVQNEESDYDIDIAVVLDKQDLGDKGPLSTRNMVANALRRKTSQFNAEPIVKTSCIRVIYAEGYHIDFAVYRRYYDEDADCWIYEHAGSEWTEREITGLTDWFKKQNTSSEEALRKAVRLSKMFCKSRDTWKNMPSGLLQTVLCDEQLQCSYSRIDEVFYYTMKEIVKRLENNTSVSAPVDNNRDLTPRQIDKKKMTNWKNRLQSKLEDLDVLFSEDCTEADAIQAWYGFFNHSYWEKQYAQQTTEMSAYSRTLNLINIHSFDETEQFIEELYDYDPRYKCKVSCRVSGDGFRMKLISEYITILHKFLPRNFEIQCSMDYTDCPCPYRILWKVKNVGPEAERRNMMRGQIYDKGTKIVEHTNFYGNHYIECYIVKDSVCVAKQRVSIPIGR